MTPAPDERWTIGDPYDRYMGRWSRRVAPSFLAWLDAPAGLDWLDVGCGTGALVEAIAQACAPARLSGIDPSAGFLETAERRCGRHADLQRADAQDLPFADCSFDRVVSALVLNFVPDQARAAAEMMRVARPGGQVAVYVWDYADGMEPIRLFWAAAAALDPAAAKLDQAERFQICRPDPLRHLFEAAGLQRVEVRAIEVPAVFRDFKDYWAPFEGGQGPAPAYCVGLSEPRRMALRQLLSERLPVRPDRSIALNARAWALRGDKPA